jgi:Asp-tRNA(Asn)/Glu-tRNA(Gln) amidotransferase A subunit family amidase
VADLELAYMPATELARRIRDKEISPVEVVDNALARIGEVNRTINAFCFVHAAEALAKARAAEEAVMRGDDVGPLHGVPTAFKDLTPTAGKTTTMGGSYMYEEWVPETSAPVVERIEAAGAISLGKTTSPEFGYSGFTASRMWGVTRNPWNTERTPGGSSGGAAAAVASGCVPFAEGSDGGGSVRIPAAFCGLVGPKPSLGRIPAKASANCFESLTHHGPLARTIDDAALFIRVAQGPDEHDILSNPATLDIPDPVPGDAKGLRLALSMDLGCYEVDPEVATQVRAAAAALADAGAAVEEIELAWKPEILAAFYDYWDAMFAANFADKLDEWGDRLDPIVVDSIERGLRLSGVQVKRVDHVRTRMWRTLMPVLQDYDALLCPTASDPPPAVSLTDAEFDICDERGTLHGQMTCHFNMVSQCPAMSVPAGFTEDGLPIGMQIVTRRFDDLGMLRVGKALEAARPWADRRPEI